MFRAFLDGVESRRPDTLHDGGDKSRPCRTRATRKRGQGTGENRKDLRNAARLKAKNVDGGAVPDVKVSRPIDFSADSLYELVDGVASSRHVRVSHGAPVKPCRVERRRLFVTVHANG